MHIIVAFNIEKLGFCTSDSIFYVIHLSIVTCTSTQKWTSISEILIIIKKQLSMIRKDILNFVKSDSTYLIILTVTY